MSTDEARKLLGGYATGSLTEGERKVLFEAALEDQELFDELAGEQVLKEVLDEPGARQRLITALEPPRHRAWLWATAATTTAATVAIVIGIMVLQNTPLPPEHPVRVIEPLVAPPAPKAALRKVAPKPASPAEPKKEENAAVAIDQLQEAKPQPAAAGAVRQFAAARAPSVFAFTYTVRSDGFLEVVPAARGFLSVTASDAVIFPSSAVAAGTPVRIPIPPDAASLVISFSGMQGITGAPVRLDEASGTVTDQDPPNARIIIQLFLTRGTQ